MSAWYVEVDLLRLDVLGPIEVEGATLFDELNVALNNFLHRRGETVSMLLQLAEEAETVANKGKARAITGSSIIVIGGALGFAGGVTAIVMSGGMTVPILMGIASLVSISGSGTRIFGKIRLSKREKQIAMKVEDVLRKDEVSLQLIKAKMAQVESSAYNSVQVKMKLMHQSKAHMELTWRDFQTLLSHVLCNVTTSMLEMMPSVDSISEDLEDLSGSAQQLTEAIIASSLETNSYSFEMEMIELVELNRTGNLRETYPDSAILEDVTNYNSEINTIYSASAFQESCDVPNILQCITECNNANATGPIESATTMDLQGITNCGNAIEAISSNAIIGMSPALGVDVVTGCINNTSICSTTANMEANPGQNAAEMTESPEATTDMPSISKLEELTGRSENINNFATTPSTRSLELVGMLDSGAGLILNAGATALNTYRLVKEIKSDDNKMAEVLRKLTIDLEICLNKLLRGEVEKAELKVSVSVQHLDNESAINKNSRVPPLEKNEEMKHSDLKSKLKGYQSSMVSAITSPLLRRVRNKAYC